jgi:hypothetical protein
MSRPVASATEINTVLNALSTPGTTSRLRSPDRPLNPMLPGTRRTIAGTSERRRLLVVASEQIADGCGRTRTGERPEIRAKPTRPQPRIGDRESSRDDDRQDLPGSGSKDERQN